MLQPEQSFVLGTKCELLVIHLQLRPLFSENYFPFRRLLNEFGDLVYCIFHNLDTFDYILNCKVQSMSIKGIGIGGTRGAVAPSSQLLGGALPPSLYLY